MNLALLGIMALVFGIGCLGGFVNWGMHTGSPLKDASKRGFWYGTGECTTSFPGLWTAVLLGGAAAVVFWCLNGPYSGAVLIGGGVRQDVALTIVQIPMSFLIGMGGFAYLEKQRELLCKTQQLDELKRGANAYFDAPEESLSGPGAEQMVGAGHD